MAQGDGEYRVDQKLFLFYFVLFAGTIYQLLLATCAHAGTMNDGTQVNVKMVEWISRPKVHCFTQSEIVTCRPSSGKFVWCAKSEELSSIETEAAKAADRVNEILLPYIRSKTCGITSSVIMNIVPFPEMTQEGERHPKISARLFDSLGLPGSYETAGSSALAKSTVELAPRADISPESKEGTQKAASNNQEGAPSKVANSQPKCLGFEEAQTLTLKGYVVEYEQDEETLAPHMAMALRLDQPICYVKAQNDLIDIIDIGAVSRRFVGRHVSVEAVLQAGDDWSAELTDVHFDPQSSDMLVVWENTADNQFINPKSLRPEPQFGTISVDVLQDYERISSAMMFGLSEIERVTFDCYKDRMRSVETRWFDDHMATGRTKKVFGPSSWGSFRFSTFPSSPERALLRILAASRTRTADLARLNSSLRRA